MRGERFDAVVVGSGPNGLAAAITLAEAGRSVLVLEAAAKPGGGLRTDELLEAGCRHDVCSTIMALAPLTPFLARFDLDLVVPPAAIAHPFDDGSAVLVERSVEKTAAALGKDGPAYQRLLGPMVERARELLHMVMTPPRPPRHPLLLARLGIGLLSASRLASVYFRRREARAVLAGGAAHSMLALNEAGTGALGLVMLVTAHAGGWPMARGGSESIAELLVNRLAELGGQVTCDRRVRSVDELPDSRALFLDLVPKGILGVAGRRMPNGYRQSLEDYRHGPGVFKLDWTLSRPIPWRADECKLAGIVHLGGTMEEIAQSEQDVAQGRHPKRPFVTLAQPTLFDPSRATGGRHIAWAYCHVPNGSDLDMTTAIEDQIERFAPGFRDVIRERSKWSPRRIESEEPNCVGGDVMGGRMDLRQLIARPALRMNPYTTPDPQILVCSAATPPGGGVHGMCGVNAARAALRSRLR